MVLAFSKQALNRLVVSCAMISHAFLSIPAVIPSLPGALRGFILQIAAFTLPWSIGLLYPISGSSNSTPLPWSSLGKNVPSSISAVSRSVCVDVPSARFMVFNLPYGFSYLAWSQTKALPQVSLFKSPANLHHDSAFAALILYRYWFHSRLYASLSAWLRPNRLFLANTFLRDDSSSFHQGCFPILEFPRLFCGIDSAAAAWIASTIVRACDSRVEPSIASFVLLRLRANFSQSALLVLNR